jgi:Fe2+ transport system protein FeoA
MRLSQTRDKKTLKVVAIEGGYNALNKLRVLGIVEGSLLTVENNSNHGPITLLNQDGMKIALGRRLAEKVEVSYV